MYHEEKVIDGKLCYRGDPDEEFTEYTYGQLLDMYMDAKKRMNIYGDKLYRIHDIISPGESCHIRIAFDAAGKPA
jgi:hypothetical protein